MRGSNIGGESDWFLKLYRVFVLAEFKTIEQLVCASARTIDYVK